VELVSGGDKSSDSPLTEEKGSKGGAEGGRGGHGGVERVRVIN